MRISDGVQTCALPIYHHAEDRDVAITDDVAERPAHMALAPVPDPAAEFTDLPRCAAQESASRGMTLSRSTTFSARSEERRVGKECVIKCRSRWSPSH